MIFDIQDIQRRIRATLPARWFGDSTPVLDSVLNSLAAGWVGLFDLLNYVSLQTRIASAFDDWLDLVAQDFFGYRVVRRPQETDTAFRQRIRAELLRDRCTRSAIYDVLLELTGRPPIIFEPTNPQDTGCYAASALTESGCVGYGLSGGWGSLNLPFQAFVRAFQPTTPGIAMINGWCGDIGGFGVGLSAYASANTNAAWADNAEIFATVARTVAANTIIWMSIEP